MLESPIVTEDISARQVADVAVGLRELAALEELIAASVEGLHGVTESVCELLTRNLGDDDGSLASTTPHQRGHWMIYFRSHQWLEFPVEPGVEPGAVPSAERAIAHCTVQVDERKVAGAALVEQNGHALWVDVTTHEAVGRAWVLSVIDRVAKEKLSAFSKPPASR